MKEALGLSSLRAALDASGFDAAYSTPADLVRSLRRGVVSMEISSHGEGVKLNSVFRSKTPQR